MSQAEVAPAVFHPERLVAVLGRFKVAYILAGSLAARLHGSPLLTAVADIVPAVTPENFESLAAALRHLAARAYTPAAPTGLPFEITADALASADQWDLLTTSGRVRVWFRPPGATGGYAELIASAERFVLHGDEVRVAAADDLLRMFEAPRETEAGAHAAALRAAFAHARSASS